MLETAPHILFETRGALGLITLNRPKALNALTHGMCIGMLKMLGEWAENAAVHSVAIRGAGERAFCAGGDIRSMAESSRDGTPAAAKFLRDEYQLNALIGAYPKPYVALTHGVVMGGGAGVSVHGRYRLADENLAFAMPETGIGFVPDIGASFFLSRCPGETGLYLGLTGTRIGLGDALSLGLITHSVAQSDHAALIEKLADGATAKEAVTTFARPAPPALLAEHRARIGTIFAASSVEAVLERLDRDGSDFAVQTARLIRTRSPESLKLTFRLLRNGKSLILNECLKMEYRVGSRRVMSADFREGVRAVLIDKDGAPRWKPDRLADVKEPDIADYFASLGGNELPIA
jgi:enoyl-CoA hydratase